jgi:hypothetical protein
MRISGLGQASDYFMLPRQHRILFFCKIPVITSRDQFDFMAAYVLRGTIRVSNPHLEQK